jgi:hypothetical protein
VRVPGPPCTSRQYAAKSQHSFGIRRLTTVATMCMTSPGISQRDLISYLPVIVKGGLSLLTLRAVKSCGLTLGAQIAMAPITYVYNGSHEIALISSGSVIVFSLVN